MASVLTHAGELCFTWERRTIVRSVPLLLLCSCATAAGGGVSEWLETTLKGLTLIEDIEAHAVLHTHHQELDFKNLTKNIKNSLLQMKID